MDAADIESRERDRCYKQQTTREPAGARGRSRPSRTSDTREITHAALAL